MNFKERLIEKIEQKKSIACMGIDPDVHAPQFPAFLKDGKKTKLEFAKALIDAVHDLIPVIKPNTRFYSMHPDDYEGDQLADIVKYAHKHDLEVIGDCKENDIGSTMAMAYENQFAFGFDAITVNAWFGSDGIAGNGIFDKWYKEGKGLFVLVKTSNKSAYQIQDLLSSLSGLQHNRGLVYHKVANLVELWSKDLDHVIGAVVGATHPDQIDAISKVIEGIVLLPGYGAQGGSADALNKLEDGRYCVVNSSRGIMYAYDRRFKGKFTVEQFADAARAEVEFMNGDLNEHFKGFN